MKTLKGSLCVLLVLSAAAWSMPLGSSTRTVIPSDIQQIISVDYRALKNSDTAMALKDQVLPPSLKEFEGALRGVGIDPDKDVEQLTFASYRSGKQGVRVVGIAQGQFAMATFLKKMRLQKVKPTKLRNSDIYPMPAGMQMTFLDDNTLLFGDSGAVRGALDARDGYSYTLDSNSQIADMIGSVRAGRLRYHQETHPGLALHHELPERRELRSRCRDFGFGDRNHAVFAAEGGHAVQENVGHAGGEAGSRQRDRQLREFKSSDALQSGRQTVPGVAAFALVRGGVEVVQRRGEAADES